MCLASALTEQNYTEHRKSGNIFSSVENSLIPTII